MGVQTDTLLDEAGTGAPNAPHGVKLSGGADALANYKPWASRPPTFIGLGTVTDVVCYAREVGDTMELVGCVTTGTPMATPCALVLPSGVAMNRGKMPSGSHNSLQGIVNIMSAASNIFATVGQTPVLFDDGGSTDKLWFGVTTNAGAFATANGNAIFSAGQVVNFRIFGIPIS